MQDDVPAGRGERQGALGSGDGLVIRAPVVEMDDKKTETCPSRRGSSRASARASASRRAARIRPKSPDGMERRAQGEPEIDGLLARVALLWQMREGTERLLEVPHSLAVGRPRHGLLPGLPAVCQGLVPHLAPQGMVGQAFDLLGQAVGSEAFEGLDDAGVEHATALLQQTPIGHLVRQGVLEGVDLLGEEPRLVEELSRLQMGEAAVQRRLG